MFQTTNQIYDSVLSENDRMYSPKLIWHPNRENDDNPLDLEVPCVHTMLVGYVTPLLLICGVVKLDEINGSPHLIHPKARKNSIMGIKNPMDGLMTIPQALGNSAFQLLTMLSKE